MTRLITISLIAAACSLLAMCQSDMPVQYVETGNITVTLAVVDSCYSYYGQVYVDGKHVEPRKPMGTRAIRLDTGLHVFRIHGGDVWLWQESLHVSSDTTIIISC